MTDTSSYPVCAGLLDRRITPSWVVYPIALLSAPWRYPRGKGALLVGITALVFLIVHLPWSWAAITGADTNPWTWRSPPAPSSGWSRCW
jgi:hypothetical protein